MLVLIIVGENHVYDQRIVARSYGGIERKSRRNRPHAPRRNYIPTAVNAVGPFRIYDRVFRAVSAANAALTVIYDIGNVNNVLDIEAVVLAYYENSGEGWSNPGNAELCAMVRNVFLEMWSSIPKKAERGDTTVFLPS
jgi:hypothetical protein